MSGGSMKSFEAGKKAPKITKTQAERDKDEKDRKEKHHAACFREVFGPVGARSDAQKYVMEQMAHFGYYDRGLSNPPCGDQEFYGREGMRSFFLWVKNWANSPIVLKKKRSVEIDKSGFSNTK
jgi:hypothetical protein